MSRKMILGIVAVAIGVVLITGLALVSCKPQGAPAPASTSVDEDDDNCLSLEELVERDEDCGYGAKSPKPAVTKTTAPVRPVATPPRPRNTRR